MSPRRLLARPRQGEMRNISFEDLVRLVEALGFRLARTRGSHRIDRHETLGLHASLQPVRGEAKPYQARRVLRLTEDYNLGLEGEP